MGRGGGVEGITDGEDELPAAFDKLWDYRVMGGGQLVFPSDDHALRG